MKIFLLGLLLGTSALAQTDFRPEFIATHSGEPISTAAVKWKNPIYNLIGWKLADGRVVQDVFKAGEVIVLKQPHIEQPGRWKFTHEAIAFSGGRIIVAYYADRITQHQRYYMGVINLSIGDLRRVPPSHII
jgi:hypothetical protein